MNKIQLSPKTINNYKNPHDSFRAMSLQELLLCASFLTDELSIKAWNEWKSRVNLDDHLDSGSFGLLPQLYHNLQNQEITDPLMMKLKGIVRKTWYRNRILFHDVSPLLHSFREANIETLILYDAALILLYNSDYGLRHVDRFCILVHPQQVITAINHLLQLNWVPLSRLPATLTEAHLSAGHAYRFQHAMGHHTIHLHWYALPTYCQANADDDLWHAAIKAEVHGVSTYTLNPTDQLLHACVQGTPLHMAPLFLRVAEAMAILKKAQDEIDWDRLIIQAQKRRLLVPLMDVLTYLQASLDNSLSPAILSRIQALPTSKYEQIEYKLKSSQLTLLSGFFELWFNYLRRSNDRSLLQKIVGFPKYLQYFWCLEHLWQVPWQAVLAVRDRLRE